MKKWFVSLILIVVMLLSQLVISADSTSEVVSHIRFPTGYVTLNAEYGDDSWFDMRLSDVPDGFDIVNGIYNGWCIQKDISMTRNVNHAVKFYTSYDLDIPDDYKNEDWDKVNYVINHKIGDRESIQRVIWYYIDLDVYPSDPDAQMMIAKADKYGDDFKPMPGELVAILVEGVTSIQRTFFEFVVPSQANLGDFVWNDLDYDGVQDFGEPGVSNIVVRLLDEKYSIIDITHTNIRGFYTFNYVNTGDYFIQFILPNGYKFTFNDVGSDNTLDSDADRLNGLTDQFTVTADVSDNSWDAGIYRAGVQSKTSSNHAPTADATAGEPYVGFIGEEITFDGSRSYDRDGRIISWGWNFGDGTKGYGETVKHIYSHDGKYTVVLTVKDNENSLDSYTTYVNIKAGNLPPYEPEIKGPEYGYRSTIYSFTAVTIDPDNDPIQYTFNWGDQQSTSSTSEFLQSNETFSSSFIWPEAGKYTITVKASDNYTETTSETTIYIDAKGVKNIGYLTDDNSDNIYDSFHQTNTGLITDLNTLSNGNYQIDYDGDGVFDYEYNPLTDELYDDFKNQGNETNILLIIVAIVGIIAVILIVIIYKRKKI